MQPCGHTKQMWCFRLLEPEYEKRDRSVNAPGRGERLRWQTSYQTDGALPEKYIKRRSVRELEDQER